MMMMTIKVPNKTIARMLLWICLLWAGSTLGAQDGIPVDTQTKSTGADIVTVADSGTNTDVGDVQVADSAWYDADNGSLRPVFVESQADDSINRDSRWLPQAQRVRKVTAPTGGGGGGGANFGGGGSLTLSNVAVWGVMLVLVLGIIGVLVYGLRRAEIHASGGSTRPAASVLLPDRATIERIQQLPAELQLTDLNPREQAQLLFEQGQYEQGIVMLFGHQLLMLDRAGCLRLNRGKTNRRYLRECKSSDSEIAALLGSTIEAFERSYFGRHDIKREEANLLWDHNLKMEQLVDAARQVAA